MAIRIPFPKAKGKTNLEKTNDEILTEIETILNNLKVKPTTFEVTSDIIKVALYSPSIPMPEFKQIMDTTESIQEIVGGTIKYHILPYTGIVIVYNENQEHPKLQYNKVVNFPKMVGDNPIQINGTFFICNIGKNKNQHYQLQSFTEKEFKTLVHLNLIN